MNNIKELKKEAYEDELGWKMTMNINKIYMHPNIQKNNNEETLKISYIEFGTFNFNVINCHKIQCN
jgi:hypothetical protein